MSERRQRGPATPAEVMDLAKARFRPVLRKAEIESRQRPHAGGRPRKRAIARNQRTGK